MNAYQLTLLGLLVSSSFLQAIPVAAPVQEVRLYRAGGEAVRHVKVDSLSIGDSITIHNLPGDSEPDGFRARLVQGSGIRLGSLIFDRLSPAELDKSPEHRAKEEEMRQIQETLEDLRGRIEMAAKRVELYGELREALIQGLEEAPDSDPSQRIWEAFEGEQTAAQAKTRLERELAPEIRQLREDLETVKRELQEIRQVEQALNGTLTIEVLGESDEPVTIELISRFQGAGWEPVYRINALPAAKTWELDYQARIYNRTGEAWPSISLTLLTGRPGWRMEAPDLPPVFLQKPLPMAPQEYAPRRAKSAVLEMAAFAMDEVAEPEVERLTTQFTLELPNPASLEPFEKGKLFELDRSELAAEFWSAITPALQETAYLHGEATIDLPWPVLPGVATLLVDGAVAGKAHLGMVNPGESLEIGFGENPAILVDYQILDLMDRDSGVFDKVRRYKRHYQAKIRNRMTVDHTVRVQSRIPVSRDEEIEVKRLEPTGVEVDPETGRFEWEQSIAPDAESIFTTQFEVTAPRDWVLPQQF